MDRQWLVIDIESKKPVIEAGKFKTMDDAFTWMWKYGNTGQWIAVREDRYPRYLQLNGEA